MKVAIIGAGSSGLTAAIRLEAYGIKPDIFERKSRVGDVFNHVAGLLNIIYRPIKDPLDYIKNNFDINIVPLNVINKVVMHGPTVTRTINSRRIGYYVIKGQDVASAENQLYEKLKTNINFNVHADYKKLKSEYDYVLIATGNQQIPKEVGCWQNFVETRLKIAEVIGKFDPTSLIMWLNTAYCKSGYVYLAPFDDKRAVLVLIVPYVTREEVAKYWNNFLRIEKINMDIVNIYDYEHISGNCFPHRFENLYFIGNAGGAIEPFLGFGQFASIMSGALAAKSIATGSDFEKEMLQLSNQNINMLELRKAIDTMDNDKYDRLIKILSAPLIKQLVYDTNFNVIKHSSIFTKYAANEIFYKPFKKLE
ncbi:FAD-dependent oxidoreductase [Thermoanaerobacterium sp. RBIITD]|uniref:FAD-dependent oxidoreductase n=1 Tax=Thermoanaerobacterium sp. RBIITD TaxID=1550240 RepID=UPI000BB71D03|nr:FAD-dependent oxidoreductase [Thermoanaerobacterium sp. RBIITD]SNX53376.1 Dehydrogenase (flavoprotein) [Thermoanaerobacterium sp. RBIITD]